jgi:hypothetical protein
MKLNVYKYHTDPTSLIGFDIVISKMGWKEQAYFIEESGLYRTHPEKFNKFTEYMNYVFEQHRKGNNRFLEELSDYVRKLPGVADKFKDQIKNIRLTDLSMFYIEATFKMFGVSAEHYADTQKIYDILQSENRFDDCISKQYFENIQLAVKYVWDKRRFSIYSVVPYIQQSQEMKQYITKEMLDDITEDFDKQVLRENGLNI